MSLAQYSSLSKQNNQWTYLPNSTRLVMDIFGIIYDVHSKQVKKHAIWFSYIDDDGVVHKYSRRKLYIKLYKQNTDKIPMIRNLAFKFVNKPV